MKKRYDPSKHKGTPVENICAWCKETDGGPWSGEALLGSMKYVHSKCYPAFNRSSQQSQKAMGVLNDFFGKLMNEK